MKYIPQLTLFTILAGIFMVLGDVDLIWDLIEKFNE